MPDARRPLEELRAEWESCRKCQLGVRREAEKGAFVFGEGTAAGAVMFVGEGPGWQEEAEGRPFVGRSGRILRGAIQMLNLTDYYISNVVACRSCQQDTDPQGMPVFRERKGVRLPKWKDIAPPKAAVEACLPRLYEEIYRIDPVIIVALGVPAAEALLKQTVKITKMRGNAQHISIPGATRQPAYTEKKHEWLRKQHGQLVLPSTETEVRYLMMPTLHPAHVLRLHADKGERSPFRQFFYDIKKAVQYYERYMLEVHGRMPTAASESSEDALDRLQAEAEAD